MKGFPEAPGLRKAYESTRDRHMREVIQHHCAGHQGCRRCSAQVILQKLIELVQERFKYDGHRKHAPKTVVPVARLRAALIQNQAPKFALSTLFGFQG